MLHKQNQIPATIGSTDKSVSSSVSINPQYLQQSQASAPTPVPPPTRAEFPTVTPTIMPSTQQTPVFSGAIKYIII